MDDIEIRKGVMETLKDLGACDIQSVLLVLRILGYEADKTPGTAEVRVRIRRDNGIDMYMWIFEADGCIRLWNYSEHPWGKYEANSSRQRQRNHRGLADVPSK